MARTGPAPLIDERRFVPGTLEEWRQLYRALLDAGVSLSVAAGIMAWLSDLPETRLDDPRADSVRRDYRRALLQLGTPPWEDGGDTVGERRWRELFRRRKVA